MLAPGFEHAAVVRLSRGAGLPAPLPDIFGIAVRLPHAHGRDRHQDVLANTTIDAPVLHHLLLPAPNPHAQSYTSSLPYRAAGGPLILLGFIPPERPVGDLPAEWGIALAPLSGRWRRIGTLTLRRRAPARDRQRFDPWQTGGGLEPAGVLNRLRKAAYRGSRRGAPAAR